MSLNTKIDDNDIKPLYEKINIYLNKLIDDAILMPGDKLPSEKELELSFNVSRITIRHAIQELVYDGKVIRIPGKGSFVLKPKIEPLTALTSFSENMISQGYEPSYKNSKISLIFPHARICTYLNIRNDEKVINLSKIMLADGSPMAIHDSYLPAYVYKKNLEIFTPELMDKISLYKILELEFGISLFKAEERVDASKATQAEAELLDIDKDDSILIIERITFDDREIPIEYAKMIYPAYKYRYKVNLYRSDKID